jgi:predicted Zn-dependent protease
MYNLLISIAASVATTALFALLLGGVLYGIVPGLIALVVAYFFLARRTMRQVEAAMLAAQEEMKNQRIDKGLEIMKAAYPLSKWQFFVSSQIDAQVGYVLYMSKKFDESEPYLRRAFKKNWVPRAMLATLLYKRKKYDEMKSVFEETVQHNKKQALLWNIYAYCLWKTNSRDEAIKVLNRGLEQIPNDDKTSANLKALQNNKNMKMRGWNLLWYQFHLETPPPQQAPMQFRRR